MPFGDRTIPSSLKVPTCNPALPGGRFFCILAAACWRLTNDSKGSRRAPLETASSPFTGACAAAGATAFFALVLTVAVLPVTFAADFAAAAGAGLVCASNPGAVAASNIPIARVFTERIVRSFPLSVFQPLPQQASPQLRTRSLFQ